MCFLKITVAADICEKSFFGDHTRFCVAPFNMSAAILENIKHVTNSSMSKGVYYPEMIKLRLTETVYLALEAMNAKKPSGQNSACEDPRVFRARKYIEDNPGIFFRCEEIADFCRISSKQLGRLFKASLGTSLLEYIHKVKLAQIIARLGRGEPLANISRELGFSNPQYFTNFFSKYMGMSPGEYRASLSD